MRANESLADVCRKCGRTRGLVHATKARCTEGVHRFLDRRSVTSPDLLARIKEMLDDGCSNREIAKTLGTTNETIKKFFPDSGWTMKQAGDFSVMLRRLDKA